MSKFTPKQNKEFWDEFSKKSTNNPFGAHTDKHVVELENNFIISKLKAEKFSSMLDVGCGNGQRTLSFSKFIKGNTKGIDYSDEMIKEAQILLSKQNKSTKKKIKFEVGDIHKIKDSSFELITSCRCLINQPSIKSQIQTFKIFHEKLKPKGSLIIAEQSKEGRERLNKIRKKFGLEPIRVRRFNLPIDEKSVFSKIEDLFKIKSIARLGTFYYISRVLHPALVFPDEPEPNSKINELGAKSEVIFQKKFDRENPFEKFGYQLLIHFVKK